RERADRAAVTEHGGHERHQHRVKRRLLEDAPALDEAKDRVAGRALAAAHGHHPAREILRAHLEDAGSQALGECVVERTWYDRVTLFLELAHVVLEPELVHRVRLPLPGVDRWLDAHR